MLRYGVIASLLLVNSLVFTASVSAQMSSVEGSVLGADGRPLKGAEIRFEQKEGQVSPIISRTDANGHYAAALPRGTYKLSLVTAGNGLHQRTRDRSKVPDRLRPASVGSEENKGLRLGWWRNGKPSAGPLG